MRKWRWRIIYRRGKIHPKIRTERTSKGATLAMADAKAAIVVQIAGLHDAPLPEQSHSLLDCKQPPLALDE
ncbi:hypothetical protein NBRC116187_00240 [Halopseudomonas sabulinigri]|uniref:Uncharacterized protein n=1 Tax=Halopseudomonas sabulinigri TaxID=472181 RepID=A0ABP9ZJQ7_9GAMM